MHVCLHDVGLDERDATLVFPVILVAVFSEAGDARINRGVGRRGARVGHMRVFDGATGDQNQNARRKITRSEQ